MHPPQRMRNHVPTAARQCPQRPSFRFASRYQSAWRTAVLYVAGIAGLIGLVGSAMVFVISNLPEVYKILAWKDRIKIWQFNSQSQNFHTIISNTGDGPVIVSAIVLYSSNGGNNQIDIRKTIAPHESISESKDNQTGVAEYQTYPSNASGTPNSLMLSHSGFIIDDFANPGGLCSLISFFRQGGRRRQKNTGFL